MENFGEDIQDKIRKGSSESEIYDSIYKHSSKLQETHGEKVIPFVEFARLQRVATNKNVQHIINPQGRKLYSDLFKEVLQTKQIDASAVLQIYQSCDMWKNSAETNESSMYIGLVRAYVKRRILDIFKTMKGEAKEAIPILEAELQKIPNIDTAITISALYENKEKKESVLLDTIQTLDRHPVFKDIDYSHSYNLLKKELYHVTIPDIKKQIDHEDFENRIEALSALVDLNQDDPKIRSEIVSLLSSKLKDEEPIVRLCSSFALHEYGVDKIDEAIPDLIVSIKHQHTEYLSMLSSFLLKHMRSSQLQGILRSRHKVLRASILQNIDNNRMSAFLKSLCEQIGTSCRHYYQNFTHVFIEECLLSLGVQFSELKKLSYWIESGGIKNTIQSFRLLHKISRAIG